MGQDPLGARIWIAKVSQWSELVSIGPPLECQHILFHLLHQYSDEISANFMANKELRIHDVMKLIHMKYRFK